MMITGRGVIGGLRIGVVHNHVHKSPPLVPILNQMNPVHINPSYFVGSMLIFSSNLRQGLYSGFLPSGFPIEILHAAILSAMRDTCPDLLDLIITNAVIVT
jgi:hypothetical protein